MRASKSIFQLCLYIIFFIIFASHYSFAKKIITFEDFFMVNRLNDPVISNNSEKIAFTIKKADIENNTYITQVWIYEYKSDMITQITFDTLSSTNPVFSFNDQFL
jgi:Tol biopolymer transport system component